MKPRIRKKDKDKYGNSRNILEWEEEGKICTKVLIPEDILDYVKKSKNLKVESGLSKSVHFGLL